MRAAVVASQPILDWAWVVRNLDRIWEQTVQHLLLTGIPIGAGFVISVGLAAVALRYPRSYEPISNVGSVLYTIPSLAAFALLLPFFGLSAITAIVPLTAYTILIFVRNIVTGLQGVPTDVRDAAVGMGYRRWRLFWEIELPIATPVIIAGLRIATVTIIGLVTVSALLGLGGYGRFILEGFRRSIPLPSPIVVGTALSVTLAAVLDLLLLTLQRVLTPWSERAAGVG